jgi:hypothetical protein
MPLWLTVPRDDDGSLSPGKQGIWPARLRNGER